MVPDRGTADRDQQILARAGQGQAQGSPVVGDRTRSFGFSAPGGNECGKGVGGGVEYLVGSGQFTRTDNLIAQRHDPDPGRAGHLEFGKPGRRRKSNRPGIEPDADLLRRSPLEAAQLLRAMTFAGTHPMMVEVPTPPAEIVDLVLHGIAASETPSC